MEAHVFLDLLKPRFNFNSFKQMQEEKDRHFSSRVYGLWQLLNVVKEKEPTFRVLNIKPVSCSVATNWKLKVSIKGHVMDATGTMLQAFVYGD